MAWAIEYTDQFGAWWHSLTADEQDEIAAAVSLLEEHGPALGRPLVDTLAHSRFANMKELRLRTMRVLFAFDPRRVGLLLIGGDKRGNWTAWYEEFLPLADQLYAEHLDELERSD